ncbi:MAG: hypothetical protein KGI75_26795, partial [Rhizobiaceae bacterium]|nr:hypothetical protein [Rhizobiaceae bacterium]
VQETPAESRRTRRIRSYDLKMGFLTEIRKAILKKGLISTVSWRTPSCGRKRRAAKAALKVKQGEKSDQFAKRRNCLSPDKIWMAIVICRKA